MSDAEIIGWIEKHLADLRVVGHMAEDTYEMRYLDENGIGYLVDGRSLRECVELAQRKLAGAC